GRPIELAEAQLIDKADVTLPRGSVVSGRVVDEFGEPVADANVSAMRMQFVNGRRRLANAGRNSQTNDLGQFRIFGLPPGEYYVSANFRSALPLLDIVGAANSGGARGVDQDSGDPSAYVPSTADTRHAPRFARPVGAEVQR